MPTYKYLYFTLNSSNLNLEYTGEEQGTNLGADNAFYVTGTGAPDPGINLFTDTFSSTGLSNWTGAGSTWTYSVDKMVSSASTNATISAGFTASTSNDPVRFSFKAYTTSTTATLDFAIQNYTIKASTIATTYGGTSGFYNAASTPPTVGTSGKRLTPSVWNYVIVKFIPGIGTTVLIATNANSNLAYDSSSLTYEVALSFDDYNSVASINAISFTNNNSVWSIDDVYVDMDENPYMKHMLTGVNSDISYFDGYSAESKPPTEIGRCDIVIKASKTVGNTIYRGFFSSDHFKAKPSDISQEISYIPEPNEDIITYNPAKKYATRYSGVNPTPFTIGPGTDFFGNVITELKNGGVPLYDPTKAIIIAKKPTTITLGNLTKSANGKYERISVTTNPPNLACRVTYDGKLDPPILEGSYKILAEITDRNHSGSTTATMTIGPSGDAEIKDREKKQKALDSETSKSEFISDSLLSSLDLGQVEAIGKLKSLADCAKSLPDKLMESLKNQAIAKAMEYADGFGVLNLIKTATGLLDQVQKVSDTITKIKENPQALVDSVIKASGVPAEIAKLKAKFPLADIDGLLSKGNAICDSLGKITADPTKTAKAVVKFTPPQISFDSDRKGNYDNFLFQLRDGLAKDSTKIDWLSKNNPSGVGEYISMITSINEIAHKHHDAIAKTAGIGGVSAAMGADVEAEIARHPEWSPETIAEFRKRSATASSQLERNTDTIQAYQQRSAPVTGGQISTGVTVYSGPDKDYTTYFDIKPSQRPPEITAYWRSQGKDLEAQEAKLNARGIKTGTLNYSDAFNGAYGKLQSDFTCASTRFKGGSVLALKNPDGTPYNPTGKNVQGLYTVTDTGNAKLTYNKVDIFTSTPEVYKNMDKVGVYLVTEGTKEGKQYKRAQSQFGSAPSSGPVSANV